MKHATLVLAASALLASSPARADVTCAFVPPTAHVMAAGDVLISNGQDYFQVCNLRATWKGVEAATCFAWFSTINTAVVEKKAVILWYAGLNVCSAVPTYSNAPAPLYVMLLG